MGTKERKEAIRRLQDPRHWSGRMTDLIGLVIDRIWVERGEHTLVLDTNHGLVKIATSADCCSETWFADIIGIDAVIGERIEGVSEPNMPHVEDGRSRQESDSFYGIELATKKGRCQIIYRNSSNGYYGGSAGVSREAPNAPSPIPTTWTEIIADWQA